MTQVSLRAAAFSATLSLTALATPVLAHEDDPVPAADAATGLTVTTTALPPLRADSHAPIGVMGEHRHKRA